MGNTTNENSTHTFNQFKEHPEELKRQLTNKKKSGISQVDISLGAPEGDSAYMNKLETHYMSRRLYSQKKESSKAKQLSEINENLVKRLDMPDSLSRLG